MIWNETITEPSIKTFQKKHSIHPEKMGWRIIRFLKLSAIVVIGEMFFRAHSVSAGFEMFTKIFTDFRFQTLIEADFVIDKYDILLSIAGTAFVFLVDVFHERGISIRNTIKNFRLPARWAVWYGTILLLVLFGAYGVGYTVVDMIYAAY